MRRWRRPRYDDEDEEDEDVEVDEEEEEEEKPRRRYFPPPRPMRVTRFSDFGEDEVEDEDLARFEKVAPLIRRGMYKPKPSDPWTVHVLYANLKELGEIK